MNKEATPRDRGLRLMVRALYYRNYRLFFMGQSVSVIGTWMQSTALGWLVVNLNPKNPGFWVGVVAFAGQLPAFFVTPFGGLVADRWNRRRMLILTQSLAMAQASLLAILFFTNQLNVGWIVGLTVFIGLVNAFDIPIRHSFVLEMVERKEDLGNAIALNSSVFNGARLVGPALAGLLIETWRNEGGCFLLNAVSYIAVVAAFVAMRIDKRAERKFDGHVLDGLKEGFRYVRGFAPIRAILLLLCLVCLIPFTVLLPVFVKTVLRAGPQVYGSMLGASGLGALAGAIFLASRPSARGLGKVIAAGAAIFGVGLILISFVQVRGLSLALAVVIGFGMMITMASSNTVLQTIADDDKRGRVMSFYTMSFMGTAPLGSLLGGFMADRIGISLTYLIFGISSILGAAVFAAKLPSLVRIARDAAAKKQAQPEAAAEVRTTTELTVPGDD